MTKYYLNRKSLIVTVISIILSMLSLSYAQESSERFIPIGQSPGISNKLSYIGNIIGINRSENTIVVETNNNQVSIDISTNTKFWLDRSKSKLSNLVANYESCAIGQKVEVKYNRLDNKLADWIKIETI